MDIVFKLKRRPLSFLRSLILINSFRLALGLKIVFGCIHLSTHQTAHLKGKGFAHLQGMHLGVNYGSVKLKTSF